MIISYCSKHFFIHVISFVNSSMLVVSSIRISALLVTSKTLRLEAIRSSGDEVFTPSTHKWNSLGFFSPQSFEIDSFAQPLAVYYSLVRTFSVGDKAFTIVSVGKPRRTAEHQEDDTAPGTDYSDELHRYRKPTNVRDAYCTLHVTRMYTYRALASS